MNAPHFIMRFFGINDGPKMPSSEEFERAAREIDMPWICEQASADFADSPDAHGSFSKQHRAEHAF